MVFSSLTFVFFFIPVTVLLYFPIKNRVWRNAVLLFCSLLFYSWGEPEFIILMLATSGIAYAGGLLINVQRNQGRRRFFLIITTVLVLSGLFFFKYLNFIAGNFEKLLGTEFGLPEIVLPIGISFYTFQILSYVIDLYRGDVAVQRNYFDLLLYVSFFPQLIAGPIVRYSTVAAEIRDRRENFYDILSGTKRFIIGLSKKVLISNGVAQVAEMVYSSGSEEYGCLMYWIAALSYTLQIYFDFSGYSDMAIGLGRIFGFHFLENFNYPYVSLSVTEFWRRWHISLSSWFRDYVYIPLGGNRVSKARWILNLMIVWALTGFWHGASWNFVLWGVYYGLILILEKLFLQRVLDRMPKIIRWIYTFTVVMIGWVIFDLTDFSQMIFALRMMFSGTSASVIKILQLNAGIVKGLIYLPVGLLFMFPVSRGYKKIVKALYKTTPWYVELAEDIVYLALLLLCIVFILSTSFNPFIYFRF